MANLASITPISPLATSSNAWLNHARMNGLERFMTNGFPKKKDEAWRYTSLSHIQNEALIPVTTPVKNRTLQSPIAGAERIVITNGQYEPKASSITTTPPVILASLKDIYTPTRPSAIVGQIQTLLEQPTALNQYGLTGLNSAYTQDGMVLYIPKGQEVTPIIDIHYIQDAGSAYTQLFVIMEQDSAATIYEHFYGEAKTPLYQHHVSRIHLQAGARLHHYRLQAMPETCTHIYSQDMQLEKDSQYFHFSLNLGGDIARHEIAARLCGERANCVINGINLGHALQHHDTYIPMQHKHRGAYSDQHMRQILKDEAKGIFYSAVTVDKDCPKTETHQLCHSLLLGKKAQAFARPELDILTDDVVCTHGATTGAIDLKALYYLQSRGLSTEDAVNLLLDGFLEELLETIPSVHSNICDTIRHHIQGWSKQV
jgi:Fe-S cluster assembly protein SufD